MKLDVLSDTEVPILNLVHVTHNADYRGIRKNPAMYEFKARQKLGKRFFYDGNDEPRGGSYIKNGAKFVRIECDERMFPGFYSWWGIHPTDDVIDGIAAEIEEMKDDDLIAYVANYLKEDPESYYGNRGFVCSFQDVLDSYAKSRHTETTSVFLRKGGTLRYTQEICYVIIVSTAEDRDALKKFDPLVFEKFQTNGLIKCNGQIKNPRATPTFCPEHTVTWFVDRSEFSEAETYSYETTVFAFYYPNQGSCMRIQPQCCSTAHFSHDKEFCIKRQQPPRGGRRICPNEF